VGGNCQSLVAGNFLMNRYIEVLTATVHNCRTAAHYIGAEHGQLPGVREATTSSDAGD